jgi:hypothetical protein
MNALVRHTAAGVWETKQIGPSRLADMHDAQRRMRTIYLERIRNPCTVISSV